MTGPQRLKNTIRTHQTHSHDDRDHDRTNPSRYVRGIQQSDILLFTKYISDTSYIRIWKGKHWRNALLILSLPSTYDYRQVVCTGLIMG